MIQRLLTRLFRRAKETALAPGPDLWQWLRKAFTFRTVIDIGAHDGEFGAFLSTYFNAETTIAFEPLPMCQPLLRSKSSVIRNLRVHPVALSDHEGRTLFYENSSPPSSSMMRVAAIHKENFPTTAGEKPLEVPVSTLDRLVDPTTLAPDVFIKMDVQGCEAAVIRGGRSVFSAGRAVLVEMSFEELYEGQPLFGEVHDLLSGLGYRFKGIKNQILSPQTGQPLFAHCLYLRP